MRRRVSWLSQPVLLNGIAATLFALAGTGCATGALSPSTVIGPEDISPRQVGASAFNSENCFHYGRRSANGPSVLPGDRLRLAIWSAGTQDYNYRNTHPPHVLTIDLRLRTVDPMVGRLDVAEQQALATFLQVNRSLAWHHANADEGAGLELSDRQTLATALRIHEAAVWNAFVGSLCVKAIAPSTEGAPVLTVQANMRALCNILPDTENRQRFARAFLILRRDSDQYLSGCAAERIPREPMTLAGRRGDVALGDWASTALGANAVEVDNYYSQDLALASPVFMQGRVEFDAVAPFRSDPPAWSLREWEQAGICGGTRELRIKALRLRGSDQRYRIVEDPNYVTTHKIDVTPDRRRELVTVRDQLLNWSLPVAALSNLTAADVDELIWAAERTRESPEVAPPGCVRRRES
ncbi:hypothetical protein [Roseomonas rosulenta]|uniref:hypothetical protein n=1 Tax=Roseomonas rosulenta TaxID=2748667 RepID=UPI0018DFCE62|nr:hypothetical protein [Roseomonas rosulenta]